MAGGVIWYGFEIYRFVLIRRFLVFIFLGREERGVFYFLFSFLLVSLVLFSRSFRGVREFGVVLEVRIDMMKVSEYGI